MRISSRGLAVAALAVLVATPASGLLAQRRAQRVASPRDTTRATVGGARLVVDYGRPSKRGRDIFPGLQPYGQVWRLGANEATHFTTDREIMIGGTRVPAGRYTLYAIPESARWTLIVNKQTGQWGTSYAQGQDLARIPMTVRRLSVPVETLTVVIPSGRPRASFVVKWDDVEASVPITVPTGKK